MDLLLKKKPGGLRALLTKDYELLHEGSTCSVLSFYNWKYADIMIEQDQYAIRSESKARWLLEHRGVSIAFCKRIAPGPKLEFEIAFDERVWCFKPNREKLALGYDIWEDNLKIGRVTPHIKLWRWSQIGATFSQMPRLEIASFAIWLVGIHWVGTAGKLTAARADIGI